MTKISDDTLAGLLYKADRAVPGPYRQRKTDGHSVSRLVTGADDQTVSVAWFGQSDDQLADDTAAYIASLDPETVRSIVTELLDRRESEERGQ